MLPADELKGPPTVRDEDGFVTDVTEVTRSEAVEELIDLIRPCRSHQSGHCAVRLLFIPALHGFNESLLRLGSGRHGVLVHRRHSPAAVALFFRLRSLELIECPEYRKPTITFRRGEACHVRRVHYHNRMELEPHAGAWLHVADGCKKQGSHHLLIARSLVNSLSHFFQEIRLRSFLDQAHQRFDSRVEPDQPRAHSRFLGGYSGQAG